MDNDDFCFKRSVQKQAIRSQQAAGEQASNEKESRTGLLGIQTVRCVGNPVGASASRSEFSGGIPIQNLLSSAGIFQPSSSKAKKRSNS